MIPVRHPQSGERGIALVVAILILLVMTLLAIVLMSNITMNREVTGHDQRMREALNSAEAGVGEALARIKHEDGPVATNVNSVVQVFNTMAGSVPALGADSTGLATAQPSGAWLDYTTTGRSGDALTISFKKNAAGTAIMRYDPGLNPAVNAVSGLPIYVIRSTGRVGNTKRTIQAEIIQKPFYANVKAAIAAAVPIPTVGTSFICGYNHSADTEYDEGEVGRLPGGVGYCFDEETAPNPLPGAWSTGIIDPSGAAQIAGSPTSSTPNQPPTAFYNGPWDALNMTQADFYSWIGAPTNNPTTLFGITHIDNNSTGGDQSADIAFHNQDGEGMLYVDGDLRINADFHYRGLVYVNGDLHIMGTAWVLGGMIVKGQTSVDFTGKATVLYSSEAIARALAKYGGQFVTLSWREM